jgi:hypothetical protein
LVVDAAPPRTLASLSIVATTRLLSLPLNCSASRQVGSPPAHLCT